MSIKKTWVVLGMDGKVLTDDFGTPQEFKSETAAWRRAKQRVLGSEDSEAWVYCLSHIAERSEDVTITKIK